MRRLGLALALLGCGLPPDPGGPPEACDPARELAPGQLGVARFDLDTRGGPPGGILARECGTSARGPEGYVRVIVPGPVGAHVALSITADSPGTDADFYAAVAVLDGCPPEAAEDVTCGAGRMGSFRETVEVVRRAGDAIWVGVGASFFAEGMIPEVPLAGRVELVVESREVHAPVLASARVRVDDRGGLWLDVAGEDADVDVARIEVRFEDEAGVPYPQAVELPPTPWFHEVRLLPPPSTRRFDARVQRDLDPVAGPRAAVRLVDAIGLASGALRVDAERVRRVGLGDACADPATVCEPELACAAGACAPTFDRELACEAAARDPIALAAPSADRRSVSEATVRALGDTSLFAGSCGGADEPEAIYVVEVPSGVRADLVVEARALPRGTAAIHRRASCADPESELDCVVGEIVGPATLVVPEVEAGAHALVVDLAGSASPPPTETSATFALRAILAPGAACDPEETENRCEAARCDASTSRCP